MSNTIYFNNGNIAKLSKEQYSIIENVKNFNDRTLIDATPGSGKTYTICCLIGYLIEYLNININNIVLLTFCKNASAQMKYKLKYYTNNVLPYAGTIHSVAYQFIKKDDYIDDEFNYFSPCEILANFHKYLNKLNDSKSIISELANIQFLIIDEYQDLDQKQLEIIDLIQTISNCKIILFGDIDQSIFQFRNSINTLQSEYFDKFKKYSLTYNYRNNSNIISIANYLLKYKYMDSKLIDSNLQTNKIIQQGKHFFQEEKIKIYGFETLNKELNHIISFIKKSDFTNKKIIILSRYRYPLISLENILVKENIEYNNLDDSKYIKNGRISIATIHASKGLEADIVILINAGNIDVQSEDQNIDLIEEINLLFVAISRAKYQLYITYHYKLHKLLNIILPDLLKNDLIDYKEPDEIIKPSIYPKNNYINFSVSEIVKNLKLNDYIKIKNKYKISSLRKKVHPSLKDIIGHDKQFLDIINFINTKISGVLPICGNYIDHFIGYIVGLKNSNFNYHPDLTNIKLVDYIGKDYNIYKFIYHIGPEKLSIYLNELKNTNIDNMVLKYEEDFIAIGINKRFIKESICRSFLNILNNGFTIDNLVDFIQFNSIKSKLSDNLKKYLSYNSKLIVDNKLTDPNNYDILLKTIFVNSLLSGYLSGKTSFEFLIPQIKRSMFKNDLELKWFNHIVEYIYSNEYNRYQMSLKGSNMVNGIIDLYSDSSQTIVDIKCSYTEFIPSQYVIQLLYYYELAKNIGLPVNSTLKLYLPLTGIEISYTFEEIK